MASKCIVSHHDLCSVFRYTVLQAAGWSEDGHGIHAVSAAKSLELPVVSIRVVYVFH